MPRPLTQCGWTSEGKGAPVRWGWGVGQGLGPEESFGLYSKDREPLKSIKQVSEMTEIVSKCHPGENGW